MRSWSSSEGSRWSSPWLLQLFSAVCTIIHVYTRLVHTKWKGGHECARKPAHMLSRGVTDERRRNRQCGPPPKSLLKCRLFQNLTVSVIRSDASFKAPCVKTVRFQTLITGVSGKVWSDVCVCAVPLSCLPMSGETVSLSAIRSGTTGRCERSAYAVSFLPVPFSQVSLCIKPLRSTIILVQWAACFTRRDTGPDCVGVFFSFFLTIAHIIWKPLCLQRAAPPPPDSFQWSCYVSTRQRVTCQEEYFFFLFSEAVSVTP